jgi:cytoskeletal protein CcmA (bactofilin family)
VRQPKKGWFSSLLKKEPAPPPPKPVLHQRPMLPLTLEGFSEEAAEMTATAIPNPAAATTTPKRAVICFDCRLEHHVSRASISTLCPACSCYIDLRDALVTDRILDRIRTRGDVHVEKKGILGGSSITCGNITIIGQVLGSVYASGTIIIRSSNTFRGEIRCHKLIIEKKVQAQFLQAVHADTAEVQGDAVGKFHITNRLVLGPKSSIEGSVEAKSITMPPTATVNGPLVINPNTKANLHAPTSEELQARPTSRAPEHEQSSPTEGASAEPVRPNSILEAAAMPLDEAHLAPGLGESVIAPLEVVAEEPGEENPEFIPKAEPEVEVPSTVLKPRIVSLAEMITQQIKHETKAASEASAEVTPAGGDALISQANAESTELRGGEVGLSQLLKSLKVARPTTSGGASERAEENE